MKLELAYNEYLKEIEIRKYTPKTIRSYRNNLSLFLRFCVDIGVTDTSDISIETVKAFSHFLSRRGHKGTYINSLRDEDVIQLTKNRSVLEHIGQGRKSNE